MITLKVIGLVLLGSLLLIFVDGHISHGHDLHAHVPSESYRLPRTVFPTFYNLTLLTHLDDIAGFEFTGHVSIEIEVMDSTNEITLHSKDLSIDVEDITLSHGHGFEVDILGTSFDKGYDLFTIHSAIYLSVNTIYTLHIPFNGELKNDSFGYHSDSYFDKKSQSIHWYAATLLEPTNARRTFPCFDEPDMKAQFMINLGHHRKYKALSNMPIMRTETLMNYPEWVLDRFAVTKSMSTYMVAFTINEFVSRKVATDDGLPIEIWARRDVIDETEFAGTVIPTILGYFEEVFGQYSGPKIDVIALPVFPEGAGALENWGLITFDESHFLVSPNSTPPARTRSIVSLIAHELAHQWFGNLVTMRWWSDLWLNEGFASYLENFGIRRIYPDATKASFVNPGDTFSLDSQPGTESMSAPIRNPDEIMVEKFNLISYNKGRLVLRMLHSIVGDPSFFNGLRYYLRKHQYENTSPDDLWTAFEESGSSLNLVSVKKIMDPWINQPGFPIVTVTRNYLNRTATIRQRRFGSSSEDDSCWYIPLVYTTSINLFFENDAPHLWLTCDGNGKAVEIEIDDPLGASDWYFFNINWFGYYHVEYDAHNLDLLLAELNGREFERIDSSNRIVLVSNLIESAKYEADPKTLLRLSKYWRQENEYVPFKLLFEYMLLLKKSRSEHLVDFERIVQCKYHDVHREDTNASPKELELKSLITAMACHFNIADSRLRAADIFEKWMRSEHPDTHDRIPTELRFRCLYDLALENNNENEWDFVWERYINSKEPNDISYLNSSFLKKPKYLLSKLQKKELAKAADDHDHKH